MDPMKVISELTSSQQANESGYDSKLEKVNDAKQQ